MKFYMPNGEKTSAVQFVKEYSDDYFLKKSGEGLVPGLRRSSEFVEKTINKILCEGIQSEQDVARILAWKIGKIKHRDSQNSGTSDNERHFKYSKDWENADKLGDVWLYCKEEKRTKENRFPLDKIATYIYNNMNQLKELAKKQPQEFLNEIKRQNFERMGSVYMITLLYFLSHGEQPIYDRFAMIALDAICQDKKPGEYIKPRELPQRDQKRFDYIFSKESYRNRVSEYVVYQEKLDTLVKEYNTELVNKGKCKVTYAKCRDIDRALWVYGHLFETTKTKTC